MRHFEALASFASKLTPELILNSLDNSMLTILRLQVQARSFEPLQSDCLAYFGRIKLPPPPLSL
jgi:hypothetical protein